MTEEDIKDWKQNQVTQHQIYELTETRKELLELLAGSLLKCNDKEVGYRAGWVDCLAYIRTVLETAEIGHTQEEKPEAKPGVISFEEHLAKRLG